MGLLNDSDPGQLLTQNPLLGGGLLAVALALLTVLLRVILKSDSRWERLNDAQLDQLEHTTARLNAAELKADAAEGRALQAEARSMKIHAEMDELHAVMAREAATCEATRREVVQLRAEVDRLLRGQEGGQ